MGRTNFLSILISQFHNARKGSQEHSALAKAVAEKPRVVPIGVVDGVRWYQVNSTRELDVSYPVRVWEDKDFDYIEQFDIVERNGILVLEKIATLRSEKGQTWIECFCPGATPPFDPSLKDLICWLPKTCYHQAAIAIYEIFNL